MKPYVIYEELVYPQVDELSRSLPWIFPLGEYSTSELADVGREAFQGQRFGVLPTLPYGWPDSQLPFPDGLLGSFLDSLSEVFEEDGWERVVLLCPQPLIGESPFPTIVRLPAIPSSPFRLQPTAVVPVGHTEQHGFHLTLNTDTVIVAGLAQRMQGAVTVLPPWPYGVSQHRRQFPGTLSVDARLFEDLWVAVAQALAARGFESIFLLNGHGGNHSFLVNVVKYCGECLPNSFVYTTFLHSSFGRAWPLIQSQRASSMMGHACELETSYMLNLRPDCVHLEWAVDEVNFLDSPNCSMDWVESGALLANPPWTDDTATGGYGAPTLASAERGREWLQVAAEDLTLLAAEAHEQHEQRKLRRGAGSTPDAWLVRWEELQSKGS